MLTSDDTILPSGDYGRGSGGGPKHARATTPWFGRVGTAPGHRPAPHRHEGSATGSHVPPWHGPVQSGQDHADVIGRVKGDPVLMPPAMPHAGVNMRGTDDPVWLIRRAADTLATNLPDLPDKAQAGYRRA